MNVLSSPPAANQNAPKTAPVAEKNAFQINDLKAKVARLERAGPGSAGSARWSRHKDRVATIGAPELEAHLPWGGLPRGALHEVAGEGADREHAAASAGFAALWLARLQAAGPVLWIVRAASRSAMDLYAHGLRRLALDPDRLILAAARRDDEALWSMEEGLKAKALGAVLGEVGKLDLTESRRLQLAAEASGVTAFVLRRWRLMELAEREAAQPIAVVTRWRIAALPTASSDGDLHWRVNLARCRGGRPGTWLMEKADGSDFIQAAPLSGDLAEVLGHRSPTAGAAIRQCQNVG